MFRKVRAVLAALLFSACVAGLIFCLSVPDMIGSVVCGVLAILFLLLIYHETSTKA